MYLIKLVVSYVKVVGSNILNFSAGFGFRRLLCRLFHVDGRRVEHPALDEGFHVNGLLIVFVITTTSCRKMNIEGIRMDKIDVLKKFNWKLKILVGL